MRKPKPRTAKTFRANTTEDLTLRVQRKPAAVQRVRIVIEVDIPDDTYSRDDLNEAAVDMAAAFPQTYLEEERAHVVYLTTEEIRE